MGGLTINNIIENQSSLFGLLICLGRGSKKNTFTTKGPAAPPPPLVVPWTIYILDPFFGETESMIAKTNFTLGPIKKIFIVCPVTMVFR